MHPSRGVEKTYLAKVQGPAGAEVLARLTPGHPARREAYGPAQVRVARRRGQRLDRDHDREGETGRCGACSRRSAIRSSGCAGSRTAASTLGRLPVGHVRPLDRRRGREPRREPPAAPANGRAADAPRRRNSLKNRFLTASGRVLYDDAFAGSLIRHWQPASRRVPTGPALIGSGRRTAPGGPIPT